MAANDLDRLAPLLATYLLHSTLWLGGCGSLLWLTRLRDPAIRHAAWKCSVVAGFLTAMAQFTLPLASRSLDVTLVALRDPARRGNLPNYRLAHPAQAPVLASVDTDGWDEGPSLSPKSPVAEATTLASSDSSREPSSVVQDGSRPLNRAFRSEQQDAVGLDWLRTAVFIWIAAVGVLLVRMAVAWRRLARLGDLTELATGKERDLLDRLLAATKIRRRVRLFRARTGTNPMAWGFWRWRIAVPHILFEQLDRRELRALLAHELAHLARGDTRWLCAWSVLGAVGVLQPLNRIAHKQIRRTAELLSDGWAVQATGDRLSLARALTKTAELRGHLAVPLASLAVASSSALAERVDRLVDASIRTPGDSPTGRRLTVIVASLAIAAAATWLPSVKLMTAGELSQGASLPSDDMPLSSHGAIRMLDHEFDSLDAELAQLEPLVAGANVGDAEVVDGWRAIERRRDRVRDARVRVGQLLEQVTAGESLPAGNP
ncbi:MAG TPA: M56 family metallopeptidase [Pirellulales bacterium]|nr:M56 family metallopeptidase [Pirellulales bacterium]